MQTACGPKHRPALRDKYLSVLVAMVLIFSCSASAQIIQYPNPGSFGMGVHRVVPDSALYVPTGCGVPSGTAGLQSYGFSGSGQKVKQSALFFDSCGHHLYRYDPSSNTWSISDSSAGGGGGGSPNTSLGGKAVLAITGTNNVKTLDSGYATKIDTTVSNVVKVLVDTGKLHTIIPFYSDSTKKYVTPKQIHDSLTSLPPDTLHLVNDGSGIRMASSANDSLHIATEVLGRGINIQKLGDSSVRHSIDTAANLTWLNTITFGASPIFSTLTGYIKGNGSGAATASGSVPTTDLSGALQAAQEPAHTGDVTNTAGSLALAIGANKVTTATIAANAVTLAKEATGTANTIRVWDGSGNAAAAVLDPPLQLISGHLKDTSTSSGTGGISQIFSQTPTFLKVLGGDSVYFDGNNIMKIFNVKTYGAKGDGSTADRNAIQTTILTADSAGCGAVFFPNGIYALPDSLFATTHGNSQLYVPFHYPFNTTVSGHIIMIGQGNSGIPGGGYNPNAGLTPLPTVGVILKSTITGTGTMPSVLKMDTLNNLTFNYTQIEIRNITIQAYTNHATQPTSIIPFNLKNASQFVVENCVAESDTTNSVLPNPVGAKTAGFILSNFNCGGPSRFVGNQSMGFEIGVMVGGEHITFNNNFVYTCRYAWGFGRSGYATTGTFLSHACNYSFYMTNATLFGNIISSYREFANAEMDEEQDFYWTPGVGHVPYWYNYVASINDSFHLFQGNISWVGADSTGSQAKIVHADNNPGWMDVISPYKNYHQGPVVIQNAGGTASLGSAIFQGFNHIVTGTGSYGGYQITNDQGGSGFQMLYGGSTYAYPSGAVIINNIVGGAINMGTAGNFPAIKMFDNNVVAGGAVVLGGSSDNQKAYLQLKAGTALRAPLYIPSGTNLTSVNNGSMEYDGTNLYFTMGGVRDTLADRAWARSNITSSGGGITLGALNGGTADPKGANYSSGTLYMQSASVLNAGIVDTANQTYLGHKTFYQDLTTPIVFGGNASANNLVLRSNSSGATLGSIKFGTANTTSYNETTDAFAMKNLTVTIGTATASPLVSLVNSAAGAGSAAVFQLKNDANDLFQMVSASSTYSANPIFGTHSAGYYTSGTGGMAFWANSGTTRFANNAGTAVWQMDGSTGNVSMGSTLTNVASALLNLNSTTKGFLPPSMTTTQVNAISSPAEGLYAYDNVLHAPYFYNGSAWTAFSGSGGATYANPTGTIGLTANNGVLTTGMRSDGTPALSQAIAPTWSAKHIFSISPVFNGVPSATGTPTIFVHISDSSHGQLAIGAGLAVISGALTATAGVVPPGSAGDIPFQNTFTGTWSTLPSSLFHMDSTNQRLGLGTASPSYTLDVRASSPTTTGIQVVNTNGATNAAAFVNIKSNSTSVLQFGTLSNAYTTSGLFTANSSYMYQNTGPLNFMSNAQAFNFSVNSGSSSVLQISPAGNTLVKTTTDHFAGFNLNAGFWMNKDSAITSSAGSVMPLGIDTATGRFVKQTAGGGAVAGFQGPLAVINDADYTVATGVENVRYHNSLTANRTCTFPAASSNTNRHIRVYIINVNGFQLTISSTSQIFATTTSSSTSQAFASSATTLDFQSDGTSWYLTGHL